MDTKQLDLVLEFDDFPIDFGVLGELVHHGNGALLHFQRGQLLVEGNFVRRRPRRAKDELQGGCEFMSRARPPAGYGRYPLDEPRREFQTNGQ